MEDNRSYSVSPELVHYGVKGMKWKNHKYRSNINGEYLYEGITNAARRGMNAMNSAQRRAGEATNQFLNSANSKRHAEEAKRAAAEKARQEKIQKALDDATQKARERQTARTNAQKKTIEGVMEPFRKVENARQAAANEINRQKKVNAQLKKERQEKIAKAKNTLDNLPDTARQRGREEINFWLSPSRKTSKTINPKGFYANGTWYKDGDSYVRSQEKKAAAKASKQNTSAQRSSAVKEKSSSAHKSATRRRRSKKRSDAINKQRIANAKASRAR